MLTAAAFSVYSAYSLARHSLFLTAGYDLGIFDQAVRAYSGFRAPLVPLKGDSYNILGDHFHPILILAAPLYWIFDDPRVLLILQAGLIASSIPVVYRFAVRRVPEGRWPLFVSLGYALGWPLLGMIDYDFHEVAFAVPILALLIDAADRRSDRALVGWSMCLLLVREDMGAVVFIAGLLRLARPPAFGRGGPRSGRYVGALLAAGGLVAFGLATQIIIPAFSPTSGFAYWTFDALGDDVAASVWHLIAHPLRSARIFVTPGVKLQTLGFLLIPLSLLPLGSCYSLLALPLLAERFFNSREMLWSAHYHYNAPIWVIFTLGMIQAGDKAGYWGAKAGFWRAGFRRNGLWGYRRVRRFTAGWLIASQLLLAFHPAIPPVLRRMIDGNAWRPNAHTLVQQQAVAQIPPDVCVAADDRLVPHLTRTNRVTIPGISGPAPDYLIIDLTEPTPSAVAGVTSGQVLRDALAAGYETTWAAGGIYVLRAPVVVDRAECRP